MVPNNIVYAWSRWPNVCALRGCNARPSATNVRNARSDVWNNVRQTNVLSQTAGAVSDLINIDRGPEVAAAAASAAAPSLQERHQPSAAHVDWSAVEVLAAVAARVDADTAAVGLAAGDAMCALRRWEVRVPRRFHSK